MQLYMEDHFLERNFKNIIYLICYLHNFVVIEKLIKINLLTGTFLILDRQKRLN